MFKRNSQNTTGKNLSQHALLRVLSNKHYFRPYIILNNLKNNLLSKFLPNILAKIFIIHDIQAFTLMQSQFKY